MLAFKWQATAMAPSNGIYCFKVKFLDYHFYISGNIGVEVSLYKLLGERRKKGRKSKDINRKSERKKMSR